MAIIKIENLSKKYIIGHDKAATGSYKYKSLRDSIAHAARGIGQRLLHPLSTNTETTDIEEFWALKDINLEIEQGDKVGIIGRNGAGKSTLLKILSRITEPTTGKITMNGRVASLLEVGTGFHPELTGRENIYLNGAVLGMTRKEIKKKFDEIVDFAGVEKFLDTPVKRFSSGMYVRLAFAVAAHLDPEILLIDEVLAVGDAEFQKKCLGKMDEVSKQGKTILFVSHNMPAIEALCDKGIYLQNGKLIGQGNVQDQINLYSKSFSKQTESQLQSGVKLGEGIFLRKFKMSPNPIESGQSISFQIEIESENSITADSLVILLYSSIGGRIAIVDLRQPNTNFKITKESPLKIKGQIKAIPFVEGEYSAGIFFASSVVTNNYLNLLSISVLPQKITDGIIPYPANVRGLLNLNYESTIY